MPGHPTGAEISSSASSGQFIQIRQCSSACKLTLQPIELVAVLVQFERAAE
jgi:hypothetical protein